ncbi:TetR/AcrR family transcriptional regulator [Paenibacillus sp. LHD-117]|uniref:TetR/AcrR family transcriptional regulator n=1 Tax=Paenibacillus sp. LHD-117 TaxID=3071412 RepID=UPI0027E0C7C5|nr:TetR/AcrR family transcriptional regulator [Paenibacillus sp. LHD-117]MDQ6421929.1 TetR/AcrR family transcriptional regulator [Paenibacillus sp. LHD-117]
MAQKENDRRVARSKAALKEALLSLMERKSFSAISITEIVETANYNRGTFYSHFENKDALLAEVISELIDELIASFREPYEHVEIFRVDELGAQSVTIFEHIFARREVYSTLFRGDTLPIIKEKMFSAIRRISAEDLVYPEADTTINPELRMVYSLHALMGLVFHWIEGGFAYTPAYMQDQLVQLIHWRPTAAKTVRRGEAERKGKGK